MKKRFCLMLCILIGICAFLGCSGNDAGLKKVELHEVTRSVFYAPQYVAAGLGYFEEEGLSVNITTSGGSDKAMTALISGDADICLAGPETAERCSRDSGTVDEAGWFLSSFPAGGK